MSVFMHPLVVVVCVCMCVHALFKTNNENATIIYPSTQCNSVYKHKFGTEIIIP